MINRLKSFKYAFSGLRILLKEEHNSRIHIFLGLTVIILSIVLNINPIEWGFIIFSIALVITVETINSAIENMADFLTLENNYHIKKIKDLSAGAVLLSSLSSVIIGLLIFIPKLISLLQF
ncbi:MAG: diacylglycerol kinase family protein [Marinifilaceae bacterium]|nr:diacylglycerol kinase family protein [Marinifilaceae bacterium]